MSSKPVTDVPDTDPVPLLGPLALGFLLPVALLLCLDLFVVVPLAESGAVSLTWGVILVIGPKLLLMPWAAARLLRLTENHYRRFAFSGIKLALLGTLLTAVLVVILSAIESVQSMVFSHHATTESASTPEYHFGLDRENGRYSINGIIDFGISRDFRDYLARHPGGKVLVLNSLGGSIYEGRGLFQIATTHNLATRVEETCASACVLAFLGGVHRSLSADGRLGFHQYAVDHSHLNQSIPFYDPAREQARDLELMRGIGIKPSFLDRAFQQPHGDIWYPEHAELTHAGVVHSID